MTVVSNIERKRTMDVSSSCSSRYVSNAQGTPETLRLHHHSPTQTVAYPGVIQRSDGATVTPRRLPCFQVIGDSFAQRYTNSGSSREFYKQPETNFFEPLNTMRNLKQERESDFVRCHAEIGNRLTNCENFSNKNEDIRNYASVLNTSNATSFLRNSKVLTEADDKCSVPGRQVIHKNNNCNAHEHCGTHLPAKKTGQEAAEMKIETVNPSDARQCENGIQTSADGKPALSYIGLIAKAIIESPQGRLSLGSIYSWIENNFPYYKNRGQGWRNSVRHNLSLNECFIKAGRCEDGKGNYWAIHPANLQDFLGGDFRQRRRSRRRGRKKEIDYTMYQLPVHPNQCSYIGQNTPSVSTSMSFNTPATMYSPYTEAERRAYRLDEALLRQSMNNPFVKWYNGFDNPYSAPAPNSNLFSPSLHHWQGYPDTAPMYHHFTGFTSPR